VKRLILISLVVLLLPAAASASSKQMMTFEAPAELLLDGAREQALDEIQGFGVGHVRALVYWRQFSANPKSRSKPRFDTADPNAYPPGTWDALDHLVDSIQRRRMTIQLTLTGPVPTWATKKRRGSIKDPSAKWFGRWARAVARRYGNRVNMWSIWNEPNHPEFLGPQYKRGKPHTPRLYRGLYAAGESAIHGAPGGSKDKVLFGETAPIGNQNVVSPIAFLRGALCLSKDYEKSRGCKKLRVDGYAHHAYSRKGNPTFVSEDPEEVSIGTLSRLTSALDKAARAGAIAGNRGIYLTEFGVQSYPDRIGGVSLTRQAELLAISERIAYANPRVKAFSQYLLFDDKPRSGPRTQRYSGFESGLRTSKGKKKPAYNGFMLPLAAKRYGSQDVLWGRVRPATGPTQVTIEHRVGNGKWKRLTALQTSGVYGFRTAHRSKHRYRAVWTRPDGVTFRGPAIRAY
jgi:Cellulase (glycosyl hydrolase family 5)